jgi:hypothetical protein
VQKADRNTWKVLFLHLNKEEQTPTSPALSYSYGERPNQNRDIALNFSDLDSISKKIFDANQNADRNT